MPEEAMYRIYRLPDDTLTIVCAQWFDRHDYDESLWVEGWGTAYSTREKAEVALAQLQPHGYKIDVSVYVEAESKVDAWWAVAHWVDSVKGHKDKMPQGYKGINTGKVVEL